MDITIKFGYGSIKRYFNWVYWEITELGHYGGTRPDCYCVENVDNTGRPIEEQIIEDRLEKV